MSGDTTTHSISNDPELPKVGKDSMLATISSIDSVIRPLIPMFLEQSQLRISGLLEAVTSGDYTSVKKIAHTMKGSASSYGFAVMATAARDIEDLLGVEPISSVLLADKVRELQQMHDAAAAVVIERPDLFLDE